MDDDKDEWRCQLTATMAARLERVRGLMTDAEFAQLLTQMVRTAERFAEIDAGPCKGKWPRRIEPAEIRLDPD